MDSMSPTEKLERRGYDRAHKRVVKLWGKACEHPCIACAKPARDWAYDGTDPTQQGIKRVHSIWPEFYMPMCHACHLRRDKDVPPLRAGLPCNHPDGCHRPQYAAGLCRMHYARWRRYDALGPAGKLGNRASPEERFLNNVQIHGPIPKPVAGWISAREAAAMGPCSVWTGYIHCSGFGAMRIGHRLVYVHRYAWEQAHGPIPVGARVGTRCLNKLCVRVDHLQLG